MESTFCAIDKNQWDHNEKGIPIELCVIDVSNTTIAALNVSTESKYKEFHIFYFSIANSEFEIKFRWDINGTKAYLFVYMHSDERDPTQALNLLFKELALEKDRALFINEGCLHPPRFQAMRVDDNSNDIEITHFHKKSTAEFYTKLMEAKGHKQLYYVHEINTDDK